MKLNLKNKKGFGLLEILIVLMIFSTVMVVASSTMAKSSVISVNNDIADRAKTVLVRVLELVKNPEGTILDCTKLPSGTLTFQPGVYYAVNNLTLDSTDQSASICAKVVTGQSQIIDSCPDNSPFKVNVSYPNLPNFVKFNESYCLQIIIENISGSGFDKVTVTGIYNDLSTTNIKTTLYGYK